MQRTLRGSCVDELAQEIFEAVVLSPRVEGLQVRGRLREVRAIQGQYLVLTGNQGMKLRRTLGSFAGPFCVKTLMSEVKAAHNRRSLERIVDAWTLCWLDGNGKKWHRIVPAMGITRPEIALWFIGEYPTCELVKIVLEEIPLRIAMKGHW